MSFSSVVWWTCVLGALDIALGVFVMSGYKWGTPNWFEPVYVPNVWSTSIVAFGLGIQVLNQEDPTGVTGFLCFATCVFSMVLSGYSIEALVTQPVDAMWNGVTSGGNGIYRNASSSFTNLYSQWVGRGVVTFISLFFVIVLLLLLLVNWFARRCVSSKSFRFYPWREDLKIWGDSPNEIRMSSRVNDHAEDEWWGLKSPDEKQEDTHHNWYRAVRNPLCFCRGHPAHRGLRTLPWAFRYTSWVSIALMGLFFVDFTISWVWVTGRQLPWSVTDGANAIAYFAGALCMFPYPRTLASVVRVTGEDGIAREKLVWVFDARLVRDRHYAYPIIGLLGLQLFASASATGIGIQSIIQLSSSVNSACDSVCFLQTGSYSAMYLNGHFMSGATVWNAVNATSAQASAFASCAFANHFTTLLVAVLSIMLFVGHLWILVECRACCRRASEDEEEEEHELGFVRVLSP